MRILYGNELSYDHKDYYETCVRTRSYDVHCKQKDFLYEHTKPLFSETNLLTVQNLYHKHVFMETFKILKLRTPYCLFKEYNIGS